MLSLAFTAVDAREVNEGSVEFEWPLTVASGEVDCVRGVQAIIETEVGTFALNGAAQQSYPSINEIWKDNEAIPGTKINIGPLLQLALAEC